MRFTLLFVFIFILAACQETVEQPQIENRFDIELEEDSAERLQSLRDCAVDMDCINRVEAMTDLGIMHLESVERKNCEWRVNENGELRPVVLEGSQAGDAEDSAMSLSEWVLLGEGEQQDALNRISVFNPFQYSCDFNDKTAEFQEGYDWLVKAGAQGSLGAANEVGVLHIDDPDLFDLAYARAVLEPCHAAGGGLCAFNLARIESLEAEDGCGRCLGLLRVAATRTNDRRIRFMYALAKSQLERGDVSGNVFHDLYNDGGTQSYIVQFDSKFPRLALESAP